MIEAMAPSFSEIQKQDVMKGTTDIPSFAREMTPKEVNSYEEANKPIRYVETRNQSLENDLHPITGVPFEKKIIELPSGEILEGVFPEFPVTYEVQLDEQQYLDSDARQFKTAIGKLAQDIENNPDLQKKFTPEQLEQIKYGETPDGYVWHHSEQPGVLQLVDKDLHDKSGHTGGRNLWGGGTEHR
ncbi:MULTISPECIES: HNH endonuclease [Bacillus]|uniref:HNH endonuclease n=1 Tax=Bacillus TaxID=1386 RepID=UPI001F028A9D|nr:MULTISPECIES: HNH endonuclease [Bacillus]MCU4787076.1 HNH endonuclease [Bacillus cereus]MCU5554497.1 HNH endonuclease [Bacillus cereus]MDA1810938.1 HNH endonuclease [Bacillus cereus]MDH8000874.1 HNH endonuclease [Bacillus cereus]MDU2391296.1 HNH endonuclease [Bacillus sp. (in: firmicutes)]